MECLGIEINEDQKYNFVGTLNKVKGLPILLQNYH